MIINIKKPFYFERGSMSLTSVQKRALDANKKLVVVDKQSKMRCAVDNNIARATLAQRITEDGTVYYTAFFK